LFDSGYKDIVSGLSSSRKRVSVAVTASNSQVYVAIINGVSCSYTADGSALTSEIVAGLVTAINASTQAPYVTASGADTPLIIQADVDTDFTTSYTYGTGNMVETVLVPHGQTLSFGKLVVLDENVTPAGSFDFAVRSPRLTGDITGGLQFGVVLRAYDNEQLPASVGSSYDTAITLDAHYVHNVLRSGRVLVKVEQAVVKGTDSVFVRFASGSGGTVLGSFRKDADTSTAVALPAGSAKWLTSASANGLAVLELNRP
jgi:hypothetical protein